MRRRATKRRSPSGSNWRAAHADVAEYQYEITVAYRDLGNLYWENLDKKDQARAAYESELAICKPLAEKHPDVPDYQAALASCYADLGRVYLDSGGTQNAEAYYKSSLAIYKDLAEKHPDVPNYQTFLAGAYNDFGRCYYTMGRSQDAEAYYKSSLAISKQLAEKYPDVPAYQISLGINYFNLGNRHRDSGRGKTPKRRTRRRLPFTKRVAKKHAGRAVLFQRPGGELQQPGRLLLRRGTFPRRAGGLPVGDRHLQDVGRQIPAEHRLCGRAGRLLCEDEVHQRRYVASKYTRSTIHRFCG